MATKQSILVIDDDAALAEFICADAQEFGFHCTVTADTTTFFAALSDDVTLVIIDLVMPHVDGVELLRLLAQRQSNVKIILISGLSNRVIETAKQLAKTLGLSVIGHLRKPFPLRELEELFAVATLPVARKGPRQARKLAISDEELRGAVERDEFVNHYQPQIDLATRAAIGFEALVRWQHPIHGLLFPDAFISRLEELELIDELGWIVSRRALSEVSQFAPENGVAPALSINVSVQSLRDLTFPDKFESLAKEFGVLLQNIVLEITESGLIQELSKTLDVLTRLRMKSVELSIDDFGTGYSMMHQLQTIPANELKIDKSFVQSSHDRNSDRVMVIKTIEIGHEMGMRVVGEGVETLKQLDFLRANGCDRAQGYYFSRPQPTRELVGWLQTYRTK
jgi:EAL domain-containing protein (putative c-di-GMP-specific phosphodiesterase class I)/FixJ family two-component response regulator